jgi:YVTN family beta-propeller protein
VVDTPTRDVGATVAVPGVGDLVTSPDGQRVHVTMRRKVFEETGFIATLDPAGTSIVSRIPVAEIGPDGLALSPDGRRAYASGGDLVFVVDLAAENVLAKIPVGRQAGPIAISPNGQRVYVANLADRTVSVIATGDNSVVATVLAGGVRQLAVSPDGQRVYMTVGAVVRVLDTATNALAGEIVVGNTDLAGVTFSPDGKQAYLAGMERIGFDNLPGSFHGKMVVLDTQTGTVTHSIPVARSMLRGVAVSRDGKLACFAGAEQLKPLDEPDPFVGKFVVLDTATNVGRSAHLGVELVDVTLFTPSA